MIEKWKSIVDHGGTLLTDLSKVFDCIPHDLSIVKLVAYGFQKNALNLVYDYLSNRKQRVKINEEFSCWKDIEYSVPQGSILGQRIEFVINTLEESPLPLFTWFSNNLMKANSDKSHLF